MHPRQIVRRNSKVENPWVGRIHKHQTAEVPIPRYQDALVVVCRTEQLGIFGTGEVRLASSENVVAVGFQLSSCRTEDVLIEKQPHVTTEIYTSSISASSMA